MLEKSVTTYVLYLIKFKKGKESLIRFYANPKRFHQEFLEALAEPTSKISKEKNLEETLEFFEKNVLPAHNFIAISGLKRAVNASKYKGLISPYNIYEIRF